MNKDFRSAQPRQQVCVSLFMCILLSLHWTTNLSTEIAYLDLNVFVALKTGVSCATMQVPDALKAFRSCIGFFFPACSQFDH